MQVTLSQKRESQQCIRWIILSLREQCAGELCHLPMVVMMVPQKKQADAMSQRVVKLAGTLLTFRPASTADIKP